MNSIGPADRVPKDDIRAALYWAWEAGYAARSDDEA